MTTAAPAYTAEIRLPTLNLHDDLPFYEGLGFRLDQIWPADDPAVERHLPLLPARERVAAPAQRALRAPRHQRGA